MLGLPTLSGIAAGLDGNIWFSEEDNTAACNCGRIVRLGNIR